MFTDIRSISVSLGQNEILFSLDFMIAIKWINAKAEKEFSIFVLFLFEGHFAHEMSNEILQLRESKVSLKMRDIETVQRVTLFGSFHFQFSRE